MQGSAMAKGNPSFLNGVPELVLLGLLSRREMYGYELVDAIRAESRETLAFGEGCIYPYLHYLEEARFIASRRMMVDGRSRLYYRLTPKGEKRLGELTKEWKRVTGGVGLILGGAHA
jgi:PadR family transcriptional regulator PadR